MVEGVAKLESEQAILIIAEKTVNRRITSGEYKDWRK